MFVRLFRSILALVLLAAGGTAGYYLAMVFLASPQLQSLHLSAMGKASFTSGFVGLGAMLGFVVGSLIYRRLLQMGRSLLNIPAPDRVAGVFGMLLGLAFTYLVAFPIFRFVPALKPHFSVPIFFFLAAVFCYIGVALGMSLKQELYNFLSAGHSLASVPLERREPPRLKPKILDTNVIIDGRIADIVKSGFLEGEIVVPHFVLEELRTIADSADPLKRARGKRGLEMLNKMNEDPRIHLTVYDAYKGEIPKHEEVDTKLIRLAKKLDAAIVTNDYNLYQTATLHGIKVLNINELAQALKPIVLPGESLTITLVREGTEPGQGVGYLDDGTMVVVEGGKNYIGKQVEVTVTSLYQTVGGKMVFAELKKGEGAKDAKRSHVGPRPGSREGKKA